MNVRISFKISAASSPKWPSGRLPRENQHYHCEHDRHGRGDDCDQDGVRADVDPADAGQYAVDEGKKRPGTWALPGRL